MKMGNNLKFEKKTTCTWSLSGNNLSSLKKEDCMV
jgi:hypothetical protein